jgi:rubrerythrin
MIKIASRYLHDVAAATRAEDLHHLLQRAIELEHATIPPYTTALLSLKPGSNQEIRDIIHSVTIDEMLHMAIAANVLNAIGGRPRIDDPDFVPSYPGPLPMGIGEWLIVGLEGFSRDLVKNVFMEIEEPEEPIEFPVAAALGAEQPEPTFATIGQFYRAVVEKIADLGDAVVTGDAARQVVSETWFGDRLFPITSAAAACRALTLIVEEGEGTPVSPVDPDGDLAHYYRFAEIFHGRRLVKDETATHGYSYSGPPIAIDAAGVYPLVANQKAADLDPDTDARRHANQFGFTYTKLLKALQRTFDGEPEQLDAALGLMFELKLTGQTLCALPAVVGGQQTGKNAGPPFDYREFNV